MKTHINPRELLPVVFSALVFLHFSAETSVDSQTLKGLETFRDCPSEILR